MDAMFDGEMRLFLEELCCELCRFRHAADNGVDPDEVNIAREVQLAPRSAFAEQLPAHLPEWLAPPAGDREE